MITKDHLTTQLAVSLAGIIAESILKEEGLTTTDDQHGGFLIPTGQSERLEWEIKYWQDWIKTITDPWEKKFKKKMLELFEAQKREVLANMKKSSKSMLKEGEASINSWMFGTKTWEKRFRREGLPLIQGIAIDNGSKVLSELPVVGVSFDVKNPLVKKMLNERSIKFAEKVVGTTEERIRSILAQGIDAGRAIPDLRDDISKWFETASDDRAGKIARTETIWASNAGAEQGYVQSGVVEGKEWLVSDDDRLCEWCASAGNQFGVDKGANLGDLFYKMGDEVKGTEGGVMELTYEGVQHPPLHVRCRCTLIPKLFEIQTTAFKPAKNLKEVEKWIKDSDIAQLVLYKNPQYLRWGGQLPSIKKKLEKANIVNSEIDRMQKDLNIKLPKIGTLNITKSKRGRASIQSKDNWQGRQISFSEEWDDKVWKNIEDWEKKTKKRWDWVKEESHITINVRHEYAHIIDGEFGITKSKEFRDLKRRLIQNGFTSDKISDYAQTHIQEFWADAFAHYTAKKGLYKGDLRASLEKFIESILEKMRQ